MREPTDPEAGEASGLSSTMMGAMENGAEIRLGDIAKITDRFDKDEDKILFNGQRAAILKISKNKAQDALKVGDAIKAFVEKEQQRVSKGVRITLTENGVSPIRDRLDLS